MNFFSQYFLKIVSSWRDRQEPERLRDFAVFYWRTLLVLVFFALLAMIWTAVGSYLESRQGDEADALFAPTATIPLNKKQLSDVLSTFEEKAARYDSLKNNPPTVTDPSR